MIFLQHCKLELASLDILGATSYIITYKSMGEDDGLYKGEMESKNPSFHSIKDLQPGVIYQFSVIAVGKDGSRSEAVMHVDGTCKLNQIQIS